LNFALESEDPKDLILEILGSEDPS
jgi:hypothetical protein